MKNRLSLALMALVTTLAAVPGLASTVPGEIEAIEDAMNLAASNVADRLLSMLPSNIDSVAVLPFSKDDDLRATDLVEHYVVQSVNPNLSKVVTRRDDVFRRMMDEFRFSELRFDMMPEDERRRIGEFLGVDTIIFGQLLERRIDETNVRAIVSISARAVVVQTGQVVGSAEERATANISSELMLLSLIRKPVFWIIVVSLVVAIAVLAIVASALRTKAQLATKPRNLA